MLGFVNKLFISVQLIFFLDHVLLLAELAQNFKLFQNNCMAKWFHETELHGIYLYCRSIFCLPHWPNFSDIFNLCLHWVSVVRGSPHVFGNFFHEIVCCYLYWWFRIINKQTKFHFQSLAFLHVFESKFAKMLHSENGLKWLFLPLKSYMITRTNKHKSFLTNFGNVNYENNDILFCPIVFPK